MEFQDPATISTLAAQTVIAQFTQQAISGVPSAVPSETFTSIPPSPTFTLPPTDTPTLTLTPTLFLSPTPVYPLISVSVPTNCRYGPGKVYEAEGYLLVGEVAEIFGRETTGNYWYIRNPDDAGDFCWVWDEYATITGNTGFLPLMTPPPTPLPTSTPTPFPDFDLVFTGLDTCAGTWVELRLINTGAFTFQSMQLTVRDNATDVQLSQTTNDFVDLDTCLSSNTRDSLAVGKKYIVSSPAFNYDPSGHNLVATVTLCSQDGLNGVCVTRKIKFKP
jgi:hypothetical protein